MPLAERHLLATILQGSPPPKANETKPFYIRSFLSPTLPLQSPLPPPGRPGGLDSVASCGCQRFWSIYMLNINLYAKSWTFLPNVVSDNCCIYGHFFGFCSPKIHMTQRALGWTPYWRRRQGHAWGNLLPENVMARFTSFTTVFAQTEPKSLPPVTFHRPKIYLNAFAAGAPLPEPAVGLRSTVVERRSLTSELSLSRARPAPDG